MKLRTLEDYLALPYTILMQRSHTHEGKPGWFVQVAELPGCMSQGSTPGVALERISDAMHGWLAAAIEDGIEIPEPGNHRAAEESEISVKWRMVAVSAIDYGVALLVDWELPLEGKLVA